MLSLVDDGFNYLANQGGTVNNFGNISDATQDMASIALENSINIPPTFYKNQASAWGFLSPETLIFPVCIS
ncbi:inner membrane protein forms channel for type IV secretion of T-DNA complex [Vibrio astriarenae]|nr:inner membrane protein forms channel for type IV secretion of T-DNA complex [Vibrio sp. C7]